MPKKSDDFLFLSSEDARFKIKEYSQILKISSQLAKYKHSILLKDATIYKPYCIFDYSYLNLILFKAYFKNTYISEKDKARIIKELSNHEYIVAIYELGGEFDLVIEMLAPNPSRFNKIIKELTDSLPTLKNYKMLLNIVSHIYPKTYLSKNKKLTDKFTKNIIIGGDRDYEQFSNYEKKVISTLFNNPTSKYTTISNESKINIKTLKKTWLDLSKKNFVKGFKYLININSLEIHRLRLFLKLHNLTKEKEELLLDYLKKTPEIVSSHKTLGDWDLEIDIESFEKTINRKIIINLREEFSEIIENFNMMEFLYFYKREYLPKFLITEWQKLE